MPTSDFLTIPSDNTVRLRRARVTAALLDNVMPATADAEGLVGVDLEIVGGRIKTIAPSGTFPAETAVDLDFGQIWPAFVDVHTHLDISHNWPRSPNRDGTVSGAREAMDGNYQVRWPDGDVARRIDFGLRCAYAHGVAAVRTHLDSRQPQTHAIWTTFREIRERWAGRIDLQATSLTTVEELAGDFGVDLADTVANAGGHLGGVIRWGGAEHAHADELQDKLDRLFELAETRGLDLDLHVDETGDAGARSLGVIARTAVRRRFKRKILCGHCCSLSLQPDDIIDATLTACADAGIAVVSLPMCNMYLQDRGPARTPRWRGITLLHEMQARGIPVSLASDDVRNPWHGFGDNDMVEVFREGVRIAHLDYPYGVWPRAVTATPASVMALSGRCAIREGGPADLVLFRARSMNELLSRPQSDRVVLRSGRAIDRTLPDYRELDDLQVHPISP